MENENVEMLEQMRSILLKKKKKIENEITHSKGISKEKEEKLKVISQLDFILLERLRKILY